MSWEQQLQTPQKKELLTPHLRKGAQGGNNAGHTIVANGITYDFHLLPSGLINPECTNLIGSGVVVHVPSFFNELNALEAKGLQNVRERIFISDRAHVVFDLHQLVDGLEEVELGGKSIGTTRKGIGPSYSTKATRSGIRIAEIFNEKVFEEKLRELARGYQRRYGDLLKYDVEEEISRYKARYGRSNLWHNSDYFSRNTARTLLHMSLMLSLSSNLPSKAIHPS
jgi:adenylosuccinate synthase